MSAEPEVNPDRPEHIEGGRWAQLTYSSFDSSGGGVGGWQVKETTGNPSDAELDVMKSGIATTFHSRWPVPQFPTPDDIVALPRRLVHVADLSQSTVYWHSVPAGVDGTGRPGNVFVHALLDRRATMTIPSLRPIDLWRSADWLVPFGPKEVTAAHLHGPDRPRPGPIGRRDVSSFLLDPLQWRQGTLSVLLDAVAAAMDGGPQVVLGCDSPDWGAMWIACVSYFMSAGTSRRLSFSTLEQSRLDLSADQPVHLVVVDRADLALLTGRVDVVLIDDSLAPDLGDLDGAPHRSSSGSTVRVTEWSVIARVAMVDATTLNDALRKLDDIAGEVGDARLHVSWPLAMAVTVMRAELKDADPEAARVITSSSPASLQHSPEHFRAASLLVQQQMSDDPAALWPQLPTSIGSPVESVMTRLQLHAYLMRAVADGDWQGQPDGVPLPQWMFQPGFNEPDPEVIKAAEQRAARLFDEVAGRTHSLVVPKSTAPLTVSKVDLAHGPAPGRSGNPDGIDRGADAATIRLSASDLPGSARPIDGRIIGRPVPRVGQGPALTGSTAADLPADDHRHPQPHPRVSLETVGQVIGFVDLCCRLGLLPRADGDGAVLDTDRVTVMLQNSLLPHLVGAPGQPPLLMGEVLQRLLGMQTQWATEVMRAEVRASDRLRQGALGSRLVPAVLLFALPEPPAVPDLGSLRRPHLALDPLVAEFATQTTGVASSSYRENFTWLPVAIWAHLVDDEERPADGRASVVSPLWRALEQSFVPDGQPTDNRVENLAALVRTFPGRIDLRVLGAGLCRLPAGAKLSELLRAVKDTVDTGELAAPVGQEVISRAGSMLTDLQVMRETCTPGGRIDRPHKDVGHGNRFATAQGHRDMVMLTTLFRQLTDLAGAVDLRSVASEVMDRAVGSWLVLSVGTNEPAPPPRVLDLIRLWSGRVHPDIVVGVVQRCCDAGMVTIDQIVRISLCTQPIFQESGAWRLTDSQLEVARYRAGQGRADLLGMVVKAVIQRLSKERLKLIVDRLLERGYLAIEQQPLPARLQRSMFDDLDRAARDWVKAHSPAATFLSRGLGIFGTRNDSGDQ